MQNADILKRINCPVLSPTVLHREAPVMKLKEVLAAPTPMAGQNMPHYKLVVLCAPAGYGKTTLLADFAQHTELPCCWYFLDSIDTDKTAFLTFLMRSIQRRFPDFGKALEPLFASVIDEDINHPSHAHRLETVIDALITAITEEIPERFAIFLCNYHEVNASQSINDIVNELLQKLPPQCILVIESRAIPAIDFATLLAHDKVVGFDQTLLRFTAAEIRDLAHLQGVAPLKEREVEQLAALFGGWIAGILLGTRLGDVRILSSRRKGYQPTSVPDMQIDRQNLFAYLVNEVFSRDPESYTFLKEAVVLQEMTSEMCNALLERADAGERLQYLEEQGLFVTRSGDGPQITYTCHPILRELLCDELRRQSPERFALVHQRALGIWQAEQVYEQAIYHALEARLYDRAVHLILESHEQMLAQGRVEMLSRWIDALPPAITVQHPRILLIRAKMYLLLGEYTLALPLLATASEAITAPSSTIAADEIPLLQANIAIARSKALFQIGDYGQAQQLCRQAIEQVSIDEVVLHAEAHTRLGVCANLLGDFTTGIAHLQKALQLWGRNSERRQTAELHTTLANTYSMLGNFALAEHHLSRATHCWERLQDDWGKVDNFICRGLIKHRQGELAEAEIFFQEALTLARGSIHFRRGEAYALVNLGDVYQDQGRYSQSLTAIEDGLALARQMKDRYLINSALCILSITYLLMGDADTAMFLVSEAKLETSGGENNGYEKVACEITRGTIFLYQRRYDEAHACLSELESYLRATGLQRELLRTLLRLLECQLAQGQAAEMARRAAEVAALIPLNDYAHMAQQELRFLPTLERALRTMPALAALRAALQIEMAAEEQLPAELVAPVVEPVAITKTRLRILALGEPAIFIDEQPVTRWRMARSMELFFLLLNSGRPLRKEQIITALWPDEDEHIAQTLHSTIHYLRKSLGEACIVSQAGSYRLDLAALYGNDIWYDVTVFQEHDAQARQALESKDDAAAKIALDVMVSIYRGDYVQSFYSDWCSFQRDKLRTAYIDARNQLALIAWRSEQYDESATQWQYILAVDSCRENAHYGLMRCYMRQGKRGLALRQYQRCVETLRDELGAEPGANIQNLAQHLMKPPSAS
jgi:LuxR family maltose regulon positive regulatory protein